MDIKLIKSGSRTNTIAFFYIVSNFLWEYLDSIRSGTDYQIKYKKLDARIFLDN